MPRFPADAPLRRLIKTLEALALKVVREGFEFMAGGTHPRGSR